jgi:hypothetical protein
MGGFGKGEITMDPIECLESVTVDNELDKLYIKSGIIEIRLLNAKIKHLKLLLKGAALVLENEARGLTWAEAVLDHINEELGV